MNTNDFITALMAEQPFSHEEGDVPEWIHLLPAGLIQTGDKRGPYQAADLQAIIDNSRAYADRLPIDENHSIDRAQPLGNPSPARGWIVELEARADGLWGRVEWNAAGRELVGQKAYRGISPALAVDKAKNVLAILRASLVNTPNLRGLAALNSEERDVSFTEQLAAKLGLSADASEDDILAAVGSNEPDTALQSQLGELGVALGCDEGAEFSVVLNTAKAVKAASGDTQATIIALQSRVDELEGGNKRRDAEAFVDQAIRDKRVGVSAARDTYIELHMQNPDHAIKLINAQPKLDQTHTTDTPPTPEGGAVELNAEQRAVATQLGMSEEAYLAALKAEKEAV